MKSKRRIITAIAIAAIIVFAAMRLISNKQSFEEQLRMISESNITIPVTVDTVKYEQPSSEFSENGTFQAMHEISIVSETQGKVVSINTATGNNVSNNQILASVDNELYRSQFDLAKFNLEQAERDLKRYEQLSKGDAATVQQYEQAKQSFENAQSAYVSTKIQFENTFIKSPFNGIITKKHIETGSFLAPGAPIFDIVEINKLKLIVKLTDEEIGKVKKGQVVNVIADAFPDKTFEGTITAIIVKADLSKRFDVEVEVTNSPDYAIKPGMFGTVRFTNDSNDKTLVIPRKALTGSIKDPQVFIVKGDSVILKKIDAVPLDDKRIAVKQGLNASDLIVTTGQINLTNGSKININK
jgi:membrane fusion protein, multidrug efflux system